jgi:hypothetical protein
MASSKATSALERGCGWARAVTALQVLAVLGIALLLYAGPVLAKSLPIIDLEAYQSQADNWDSFGRGGTVLFYDDMEHGTNGWTTVDEQAPRFHIDTYMAFSGLHSWWCGTFAYGADGGYGNLWDQRLDIPLIDMAGYAQPMLQFYYRCDSELDWDYTYVEAMSGGGYEYGILGEFTGTHDWDLFTYPSLVGFDNPAMIRFRFVSDGNTSDEDKFGGFNSIGGAFMCDNIRVFDAYTGVVLFYDDCESGGRCTPSVPAAGGTYWHIISRACWATTRPHSWWCGSDADTLHIPAYVYNSLVSPAIDVSGLVAGTPCVLSFRPKVQTVVTGTFDAAWFSISTDDGQTWINPYGAFWSGNSSCGPQGSYLSFGVTPYLPASSLRFKATFITAYDGSGPGPYNGAGLIMDDVRLVAWPPPLTQNVVCDPDPAYLTASSPTHRVAVDYLGGGSGLLYGYSVKFTWDGTKVSTAPDKVRQGRLLYYYGSHGWTQRFFRARSTGANEITVDSMLLGDEPGVAGPGTMFTVDFTGLSVGTSPIDVTVLEVRDRDNNLLTGFAEDDGQLIVDVQKPVITSRTATWRSSQRQWRTTTRRSRLRISRRTSRAWAAARR